MLSVIFLFLALKLCKKPTTKKTVDIDTKSINSRIIKKIWLCDTKIAGHINAIPNVGNENSV